MILTAIDEISTISRNDRINTDNFIETLAQLNRVYQIIVVMAENSFSESDFSFLPVCSLPVDLPDYDAIVKEISAKKNVSMGTDILELTSDRFRNRKELKPIVQKLKTFAKDVTVSNKEIVIHF